MSYSGKFKDKNNNLHPVTSVLYGTCDTAAGTAAKVVTCADFDTLMTGVTIRVKFDNANTAASPTVNINSTGAKSVYRFGSTAPVDGDSWKAGEVVDLLYDGTSFFMVSADDIGSKQDALAFDDTPTDGSNNPVKSNGIYDSEKDIYAVIGEMGAKNFIPYPYVFNTSINRGITFTANDDGTVSFSGTADNASPSVVNMITRSMFKLKKGSYTLSGGSGSYGGISIYLYDDASGTNYTGNYTGLLKSSSNQIYTYTTLDGDTPTPTNLYGYDKTFTIEKDAYLDIQARSMTNSYAQLISGVIYPMLRLASDTDGTYQPYAKTNKQLTDDVTLLDSEKTDTDIVASDFSTAVSYTAGDYCIYGGKFYKFKNNHSGAWSAADVDEIKIAGELASLKSGLTNWINVGSATASHYSIKSQTNNIYVNTALRRVRFVADITFNSYGGPDSWFAMFSIPNDLISYKPPYNVSQVILTDNCKRVAISKNNVNNVFAAALLDAIPEDDKTYVVLEWSY